MRHFQLTSQATGAVEYVTTRGQRVPEDEGVEVAGFDVLELARQPGEHDDVVDGRVVKNKAREDRSKRLLELHQMDREQLVAEIMRLVDERVAAAIAAAKVGP